MSAFHAFSNIPDMSVTREVSHLFNLETNACLPLNNSDMEVTSDTFHSFIEHMLPVGSLDKQKSTSSFSERSSKLQFLGRKVADRPCLNGNIMSSSDMVKLVLPDVGIKSLLISSIMYFPFIQRYIGVSRIF